MPFGLCNAPATFQRLMQCSLNELIFQILLVYMDDIIVYAKSFEDHLQRLDVVFTRLKEHGLKLKPSKCEFLKREVTYLGYKVSAKGIATDPEKTRAVASWNPPKTLKELRSFIGFASYYRQFIQNFATVAGPLHQLVNSCLRELKMSSKLEVPFIKRWNRPCQEAFETLKQKLITAPVLGYANFEKPFVVEVDASLQGLGAVLSQEQTDCNRRVIAYASRCLWPAERNILQFI